MRRRRSPTPFLLALVPLALVLGIWLGANPDRLPGFVRDAVGGGSQARLYDEAMDIIEEDYYRRVDRDVLLNRSLNHAVGSLSDQFSFYFSPKAYGEFKDQTAGEFQGVGMTVEEVKAGLRILTVFPDSPAAKGGLRPGDVIVGVNGTSLRGKSSNEGTGLIRGKEGTEVRLRIRSKGARERDVTVRRARVDVPVVRSAMERSGGVPVAHVALSSFVSGAHGEVGAAVRRLLGRGAKGVVLDLRDNGGGLLNEAVLVSSIFIPEGLVVKTRGRNRPEKSFEATGGAIKDDIPVTVLVNGNSASASEIVAGALQDRKRGTVVGTKTFGKGVFQEVKPLSNGGALDITVGEYYTPSGRNLGGGGVRRGAGIAPDVRAQDREATRDRDEALAAAVRTVARKG